jgi:pyruvate carboxylase
VLPPSIFFKRGGFALGEALEFVDHDGKGHIIEIGPEHKHEDGSTSIYLNVDHYQRVFIMSPEVKEEGAAREVTLSKKEIQELARIGDVRTPFGANVCEVSVAVGQEVAVDDKLVVLEAMKMQTPVLAVVAGKVEKIAVKVGDALKVGGKILKISCEGDAAGKQK